ncbi:MAG: hypothetical protein RLZZ387_2120 [Chloroflexota bacterium]|jgi:(2Fe-2S) ferredoxin
MSDEKQYRIYLCGGVNCAPATQGLLRALEDELWAQGLTSTVDLRVSSCQNRCEHGPNATVWPGPCRYAHLTADGLRRIVAQHLRDGAPVAELLHTLR